MALSEHELTTIRSWVGTGETDEVLEAAYTRIGSFDGVIRELLNKRITTLAAQPQSISVPGLSLSNGSNLTAWQDALKRFNLQGGSGLDVGLTQPNRAIVGRLVRSDLR